MIPQAGIPEPERKSVLQGWEWADMPKYEKITAPEAPRSRGSAQGPIPDLLLRTNPPWHRTCALFTARELIV